MRTSDHELAKLFNTARKIAGQMGYYADAEDLAQEVVIRKLKNKGAKQSVYQSLVDAIRETYGRSQSLRSAFNYSLRRAQDSSDQCDSRTQTTQDPFSYLAQYLTSEERTLIFLRYKWEFSLEEIGECLGVHGSRISQKLSVILEKLKDAIIGEAIADHEKTRMSHGSD